MCFDTLLLEITIYNVVVCLTDHNSLDQSVCAFVCMCLVCVCVWCVCVVCVCGCLVCDEV